MAEDTDDFKIKGAASRPSSSHSEQAPGHKLSHQPDDTTTDVESDAVAKAAEVKSGADSEDEGEISETMEQLQARYRWYQCDTTPPSEYKYYYHCDTGEISWDEPDEPYFIYNSETQSVDPAGLQYPKPKPLEDSSAVNKAETSEPYMGYNPKIHGNYDPNADYAQYHNQKRAQEAAFANPQAASSSSAMYESTMTLNRFTGNVQAADLNPERHSDQAKSGRQMNAFFDVDAAANAHGGKSLKEERTNQKISKNQVKKFQEAKKQKKRAKQMAFLLS